MSWREIVGAKKTNPKPYAQNSQNPQNLGFQLNKWGFEDNEDIEDDSLPFKTTSIKRESQKKAQQEHQANGKKRRRLLHCWVA